MADFDADYYKGRMEEFRRDLRWWIELGGKLEAVIADHPRGRIQTAGTAYLADDLKLLLDREDRALTRAEAERDQLDKDMERLLEAVKPVAAQGASDGEANPYRLVTWGQLRRLYKLASELEAGRKEKT